MTGIGMFRAMLQYGYRVFTERSRVQDVVHAVFSCSFYMVNPIDICGRHIFDHKYHYIETTNNTRVTLCHNAEN